MDDYQRELETERTMKDQFMARHPESPFVSAHIGGFDGLRYYPFSAKYRVRARLERLERPEEAYLRTNRDGQAVMRYLGDLVFSLERRSLKLRVYHAGEGVGSSVFVPFRDGTSGRETYGPGRYLIIELNPEDEYDVDFNRAFNPYCAYTDAYECGFPPSENDLPVPIRAGEKVWSKERNPATPSSAVIELVQRSTAARPKSRSAKKKPRASPTRRSARRRKRT